MRQIATVAGKKWLAEIISVATAHGFLHLFQSGYVPDQGTTLADMDAHKASFAGYDDTAQPFWYPTAWDVTGQFAVVGAGDYQFGTQAGTGPTQIIAGYYLVSETGSLVSVAIFDTPVTTGNAGQASLINVRFHVGDVTEHIEIEQV